MGKNTAQRPYCQATTRAQQFGASYASTTWSCSRRGVVEVDGKLMCRQHAAMYRRDNGLEGS